MKYTNLTMMVLNRSVEFNAVTCQDSVMDVSSSWLMYSYSHSYRFKVSAADTNNSTAFHFIGHWDRGRGMKCIQSLSTTTTGDKVLITLCR